MKKKDPHDQNLKLMYSVHLNREISDRTWEKAKRDMKACGIILNNKSLELFANFRRRFPRLPISKEILTKADNLTKTIKSAEITSIDLMKLLRQAFPDLLGWQYYRCFENAEVGYSSNQRLSIDVCKRIILMAVVKSETTKVKKEETNAQQNSIEYQSLFEQIWGDGSNCSRT